MNLRLIERLRDAVNEPQDLGSGEVCELSRDAMVELLAVHAFGGGFYADEVLEATRDVYRKIEINNLDEVVAELAAGGVVRMTPNTKTSPVKVV